MTPDIPSAKPRRGRAALLLAKVIEAGTFEPQVLASELVVSEKTLGLYASGELEMPLERQAILARLLLDRAPELRRECHGLLGQVQAAASFARSQSTR